MKSGSRDDMQVGEVDVARGLAADVGVGTVVPARRHVDAEVVHERRGRLRSCGAVVGMTVTSVAWPDGLRRPGSPTTRRRACRRGVGRAAAGQSAARRRVRVSATTIRRARWRRGRSPRPGGRRPGARGGAAPGRCRRRRGQAHGEDGAAAATSTISPPSGDRAWPALHEPGPPVPPVPTRPVLRPRRRTRRRSMWRPSEAEQRGQQGDGGEHGDEHGERRPDGETVEERRCPSGACRAARSSPCSRRTPRPVRPSPMASTQAASQRQAAVERRAVAGDDEQRVVDAHADADHRRDLRR